MLSCKDISHLASDHIDNNLPFFTKMKVRMHLFLCVNCRNFINQFRTTVETVHNIKPVTVPDEAVNQQVEALLKVRKSINSSDIDNP